MLGKFITVEGIDGAGKSTYLAWLSRWVKARNIPSLQTREPGGSVLGEHLRSLVLTQAMQLQTETLLLFAGRNEHLQQTIEPALQKGIWVLCDRFSDATYAYQCGGRGLSEARFEQLQTWVQQRQDGLLQPDLTLLFDLPVEISQKRLASQASLDRFEKEDVAFHQRVRLAYLQQAAAMPDRIKIIDATQMTEAIQNDLCRHLVNLLKDAA